MRHILETSNFDRGCHTQSRLWFLINVPRNEIFCIIPLDKENTTWYFVNEGIQELLSWSWLPTIIRRSSFHIYHLKAVVVSANTIRLRQTAAWESPIYMQQYFGLIVRCSVLDRLDAGQIVVRFHLLHQQDPAGGTRKSDGDLFSDGTPSFLE